MTAEAIIKIIEARRDEHFDAQVAGTASDPTIYSGAAVSWLIADEYDSLLQQIRAA